MGIKTEQETGGRIISGAMADTAKCFENIETLLNDWRFCLESLRKRDERMEKSRCRAR